MEDRLGERFAARLQPFSALPSAFASYKDLTTHFYGPAVYDPSSRGVLLMIMSDGKPGSKLLRQAARSTWLQVRFWICVSSHNFMLKGGLVQLPTSLEVNHFFVVSSRHLDELSAEAELYGDLLFVDAGDGYEAVARKVCRTTMDYCTCKYLSNMFGL
jgi:hypothetical protein